jgi:hypothetical protein
MMPRSLDVLVGCVLLLVGGAGNAQQRPARTDSETRGSREARALPLRLSLLSPLELAKVPTSFSCEESSEELARTASLIQLNAASLAATQRLTLHAFSRWGCPSTAAAGAGFSFNIQLSPGLAWVFSGGAAYFPHISGNGSMVRSALRTDLLWTTKDGQVRAVGVDALQIFRGAIRSGAQRRIGTSVSGSF